MNYKLIAKALDLALGFEQKVNPRAVEFLLHYLGGTQTDMVLTDREIELTKGQVLEEIEGSSRETLEWQIKKDGYIAISPSDLKNPYHAYSLIDAYFCHETMGVVGGFDCTIDFDKEIAHCYDTWDFNTCSFQMTVPCNPLVTPFLVLAFKLVGVKLTQVKLNSVTVCEESLTKFNENHKFSTKWEVSLNETN